jgi:hypothetical protein
MRLTGFTITDATDLEDKEKPIPKEIEKKMDRFLRLSSIEYLFNARPCMYIVFSIVEPVITLFASSAFGGHSGRGAQAVGN